MARLGDGNPLARIFGAMHGWLSRRAERPPTGRRPRVVAHRGAARVAPENTIEAFCKAAELGADAIETDICATKDGHFVLWHDADPDDPVALVRQTSGEGMGLLGHITVANLGSPFRKKPCDLTLAELRAHYGYVTRAESGERPDVPIALLDELLDWLGTQHAIREVFLDLKLSPHEANRIPRLFDHLLGRMPRDSEVTFNVLLPQRELLEAALAECRGRGHPERIRIWGDFEWPGAIPVARRYGLRNVSMGLGQRAWADLRQELDRVLAARDAGRLDGVLVWTVDDEKKLRELSRLGVDGILTNDPETLRRIVSEMQE